MTYDNMQPSTDNSGSQAQGSAGSQFGANAADQIGQWVSHYQQGNYNQVPTQDLHNQYNQFAQQADPAQVHAATTYGYQQVPQQEHSNVASTLLGFFQQHGLSPQAAGVQTTNPQQMTPQDMSKMTQYAQQQQPDALHQLFQQGGALSNPLIGMAVAGALAYGASQMFKR